MLVDEQECEDMVQRFMDEPNVLLEIHEAGLETCTKCCAILKSNTEYAAEAAAEARLIVQDQTQRIGELEDRYRFKSNKTNCSVV